MSKEDPFKKSPITESGVESEPGTETPVVDVEKLKALVEAGELPTSVLGLYEEFYTPGDQKPFFEAFARAEPEKQQAILRALKRTSDKVDSLPPEVADKKFKLSLSAFIVFIYTMFLARTMALRITTDATLDPGKNEEGALLRILELNGAEVFSHPEKFEITDFKEFLVKIIYAGHGREVLEHLGEIDTAYHADIIFHCLQVSRQRSGKLEAVYVIDALPACKQLSLEVATQLCRLGFDQVVLEHLEAFSEAAVQETVLLLLKRKKLGFREIFTAVLELPHKLLVKQILISVCFLDKKAYASLQLPEHEDVLNAVKELIPNLEEQCSFLRTAMSGNRHATKSIEIIPNSGVLKALLDQHGYPLPPRNKALGSLDIFMSVEYIPDHLLAEMLSIGAWREIYFPGLKELSDASAKKISEFPFGSVGIGFQTAISPQAKEYFSEARGWFPFLPEYEDRFHICSDKTADVAAIGLPGMELFPAIKVLSVASAQRLLKHQEYHKGTMRLDGLITLDPEAAKILLEYKIPLTLNGLTSPKEDEPFDPNLRKLLYRSIKYATKIGAVALRGAIEEMEQSGEGDLVLPCLESLTNETARILARLNTTIHLPNVQSLSVEQAKLLSHHEGYVLDLGLTEMSEEVALALAQHQGSRLTFSA
ncbi:hypothetical protein KBA73_05215, partial [Patescibacteria group bacterium]|nr:hypothetical protein [Patescibacteria group bacterium]